MGPGDPGGPARGWAQRWHVFRGCWARDPGGAGLPWKKRCWEVEAEWKGGRWKRDVGAAGPGDAVFAVDAGEARRPREAHWPLLTGATAPAPARVRLGPRGKMLKRGIK